MHEPDKHWCDADRGLVVMQASDVGWLIEALNELRDEIEKRARKPTFIPNKESS